MNRYGLKKWAAPGAAVLVLMSGFVVPRAAAQAPPPRVQADGKIYTKQVEFHLPIQIDERARPSLKDVSLFVKDGAGPWARVTTAPPTQKYFTHRVTHDGEYWFSVVTMDRNGTQTPADVTQDAPGLKVVVDTQAPTFDLQRVFLPAGQTALRCTVQDANPDAQAIKISYRGPDQAPHLLELVPGQPGMFRVPTPELFSGSVAVSVTDRAGNQTVRDVSLREMAAQAPAPGAPPAPSSLPQAPATSQLPPAPPVPGQGILQTAASAPVAPGDSVPATHTAARPAALESAPAMASLPAPMPLPGQPQKAPGLPSSESKQSGPVRQIINSKHASIEYRIDPVGPSGVGKVELWMTADKGASWQRAGEDVDRRSPAEIDLPGEGLYGIRLAVTNGNGFGGATPAPGDTPHSWIEVDTTAPVVQLRDIDPMTSGGTLEIRWVATDKNLSAEPINLYYATKREGPWQPLARNVKNDGSYRWGFPHDAGNQFFVRLEVTDQAGNSTRCETPMPVVLDMTEPHALVVGVTGSGSLPSQAH